MAKVTDEIPTGLNLKTEFHGKALKHGEIQFPVKRVFHFQPPRLRVSAPPRTSSFPFNLGVQVVEVKWDRLAEY